MRVNHLLSAGISYHGASDQEVCHTGLFLVACRRTAVSRKRIERVMRQHGLRARAPRRYRVCTTDRKHSLPVAPNLLDQNFVADRPNQVWLADITYIATGEGWLYLAVILDLLTRKVVGWAMRDHMRAELTRRAHHGDPAATPGGGSHLSFR
jgi:transposase InsO family protein